MQNDFVLMSKNNVWFGVFPLLEGAGFINACSCRLHGKSKLVPSTLNLALHVGDEQALVLENRRRFCEAIGVSPERITTCAQVHGSKIEVVTENLVGSGAAAYATTIAGTDALITNLAEVPLLLFFADCVPVLLADPVSGAFGLAHAGWRGSVAEIAKKTVARLGEVFGARPENILAAIGPSIGPCCYEVDDYVLNKAPAYSRHFLPKGDGKYQLDLWELNRQQLLVAGLTREHISLAHVCTNDNKELFCSYRAEKGKTGRMGVCLCKSLR